MPTKLEFITSVRSKYPQYQAIDDETLYTKLIEKYPTYSERITEDVIEQPAELQPIEQPAELQPIEQPGFIEKAKDMFTGESRMTPEMESLENIGQLPELNEMSISGLKAAFVSMTSDPEETVQALKANYPGLEARQDEKGNWIVKSPSNQQEYSVNVPGLDGRDMVRGALAAGMFASPGKVASIPLRMASSALTQGVIEKGQEAAGGEKVDLGQVAAAGITEAILPVAGKVLKTVKEPVKKAVAAVKSTLKRPVKQTTALTLNEIGKASKKAALGSEKTKTKIVKNISDSMVPDSDTIASAKRLRIEEYLEPDHISSDQAFKELSQAIKSVPGSKARIKEQASIIKIKEGIESSLSELGASDDLSFVDDKVKKTLQTSIDNLDNTVDKLYRDITNKVSSKTRIDTSKIIKALDDKALEVDGVHNLPMLDRKIYKKMKPREGVFPTYGLLDQERKIIGQSIYKKTGPYKNEAEGSAKYLYKLITEAQEELADKLGHKELVQSAKKAVATRKSLEGDMTALFGKTIDGSIIGDLTKGIKSLQKQDTRPFINFIKSIPPDMRQEVTASGLGIAFSKNAKSGKLSFNNYADWYSNLKRNKQAYGALMVNLPPRAKTRLKDFYNVSNAISKTSKEYIATGRLQAAKEVMEGSDSLIGNIWQAASSSVRPALIAEGVTTMVGLPGAGTVGAIMTTLQKGKPDVMKLADDLISSDLFISAIKKIGTPDQKNAITKISKMENFKKLYNKIPNNIKGENAEKWLTTAIQSYRQTKGEN